MGAFVLQPTPKAALSCLTLQPTSTFTFI